MTIEEILKFPYYDPEEFIEFLEDFDDFVDIKKDSYGNTSRKVGRFKNKLIDRNKIYLVFKQKGIVCVNCSRKANCVYITDTKGIFVIFNSQLGTSEFLTKDHIVPVAKGGKHEIENLQPMCYTCNQNKKNKIHMKYLTPKLKKKYRIK